MLKFYKEMKKKWYYYDFETRGGKTGVFGLID